MRKGLLVIALILASILGIGLAPSTAGAQTNYNYYDWGWVQGYYGGIHLYMYDYCPYTSSKGDCRDMHYDHHVVAWNQVIPDSDSLPEWVWLNYIIPGQAGTSALGLIWAGWGAYAGGNINWHPGDDPSTCPQGQQVCGLYSLGMRADKPGFPTQYGGNTAHARFYQQNVQCGPCNPDWAYTYLY